MSLSDCCNAVLYRNWNCSIRSMCDTFVQRQSFLPQLCREVSLFVVLFNLLVLCFFAVAEKRKKTGGEVVVEGGDRADVTGMNARGSTNLMDKWGDASFERQGHMNRQSDQSSFGWLLCKMSGNIRARSG